MVRRATSSDVSELLRIEQTTFTANCIKPRQMRYLVRRPSVICLVNAIGDELAGYILTFTPRGGKVARIYSFAVDETHRGTGLGGQLLRETFRELQALGIPEVRLEVRALDQHGQDFYSHFGFRHREFLTDYYEDHADAYRMALRLDS